MDSELVEQVNKTRRPVIVYLLIVLLIIIAAGVAYSVYREKTKYSYTYSQTQKTDVSMGKPAQYVLSINKPPELQAETTQGLFDQKNYEHKSKDGKTIALLSATTVKISGKLTEIVTPHLETAFSKPSADNDYKNASRPMHLYVQEHLPKGSNVILEHAESFSSNNIKKNAWQFDFSPTDSSAKDIGKWRGQILYIWTEKYIYYVLLGSIDQNWQSNQQIWQEILKSIEVE